MKQQAQVCLWSRKRMNLPVQSYNLPKATLESGRRRHSSQKKCSADTGEEALLSLLALSSRTRRTSAISVGLVLWLRREEARCQSFYKQLTTQLRSSKVDLTRKACYTYKSKIRCPIREAKGPPNLHARFLADLTSNQGNNTFLLFLMTKLVNCRLGLRLSSS